MKTKSIFAIILIALFSSIGGGVLRAYNFSYTYQGKTLYYTVTTANKVTVSPKSESHLGYVSGRVVIPSRVTYDDITYSVTSISNNAFNGCDSLTSILIPTSVIWIGDSAFMGCSRLTSIPIPNSIWYIGSSAFKGCSSLTGIKIPNSVTKIGLFVFDSCSSLVSIAIQPGGRYDSRNNCNAIIEKYKNKLVQGCKNTIIPTSVTSIGEYAFHDCIGLTKIKIPSSITKIYKGAFEGCSNLASIEIPFSVTDISYSAFFNCSNLSSISVHPGNQKYDSRNNCNAIIETATNTLIVVCKNTIIPNSVTSIGYSVSLNPFKYCNNLAKIIVQPGNPEYDSRDNCNAIIETATNTLIVGCKNTIIPNSVTSIGSEAFYGCSSLTSITIPNSVTEIDGQAFYGCNSLTSITMPSSINNWPTSADGVGDRFFENWSSFNLDTIIINSNGLQNNFNRHTIKKPPILIIENSVTSIGYLTFYGCSITSITSITIPNSVTSIGDRAFENCTSLTSITIPNSVTSIGDWAFKNCSSLTSITIPNSVTFIGYRAFYGCPIKTIYLNQTSCPDWIRNIVNSDVEKLFVPKGSSASYKKELGQFNIDIQEYEF